jgi:hypothetical protein
MNGLDPRPRRMEVPESGYWLIRCCTKCPWCPAALIMVETIREIAVPENDMRGTRSPHLAGYISGQPVATDQVWQRRGKVITREQYDALIAEIRENIAAGRYDSRTTPYRPVDLSRVEIPFAENTNG